MKKILTMLFLALLSCGDEKTLTVAVNTGGSEKEVAAQRRVTAQAILHEMETGEYREGELLVKFKSGTVSAASAEVHHLFGARVMKRLHAIPNLEHVKLPDDVPVRDAVVAYMSDPRVEYAEPNYKRKFSETVPDDEYFRFQWALRNTAMGIVGGTAQKDRNFAFMIAAQVVLGVVFFLALPLPRVAGIGGVMLPLAGLALITLLTVGWIPQPTPGAAAHGAGAGAAASPLPALAALAVMLIWCTGLGAMWFFVKLIGVSVTCPGCDEAAKAQAAVAIGQALGLSTGVAVAGALAAAALADRFGRLMPVTIALAVQFAMVRLLQGEMPWLQFTVTAMPFQAFWNLTGPYMMGTVALNDATGKVSLLIPTAQIGGFFLGPTIVSLFIKDSGLGAVNVVSATCILLALVLFIPVANRVKNMKGGRAP